jgi:serine/threonine protein kinase
VFRAYQPDPGRLVAVKQFRLDLPPETAHRFVAALDRLIAADLTHLGIAAPLAAGLADNSPYLATDFVAAESFDVVVRDYGPAPVSEALRIATQLGGALDFAAAVNVYHGALHPRDVLVSTDDTRVTGLGIAQALEQIGVAPPVRRPYTAPERIAGGAWDRRADSFSLAALVYEMLFGRRIAGTGRDAAAAVTPVDGADVEVLGSVFARALAESPDDRFDTALAFADALQSAFAQPARPAGRAGKTRRKRDTEPTPAPQRSTPPLPLETVPDLPLTLAAEEPDTPTLDLHQPPAPPVVVSPSPGSERAVPPRTPAATDSRRSAAERPAARSRAPESPAPPISAPAQIESRASQPPDAPAVEPDAALPPAIGFADLELARAETDRFQLADSASALPEMRAAEDERPTLVPEEVVRPAASAPVAREAMAPVVEPAQVPPAPPAPPVSLSGMALEKSRSAIWPLALALVVGLLVGFAFGYGFGTRDRGSAGTQVATAPAPSTSSQPAPPASGGPASTPSASPSAAPAATAPQANPPAQRPSAPERTAPRPQERASTPAPAAESGRILVRSTPAGARVTVDGRDAGQTPATVTNLAMGTHSVRITHQGYLPAERRVRIRNTQPAQSIEVELEEARAARQAAPAPAPERSSGSLMVDSRPAGARVLVDGKMVGTTPMLLDAVVPGDHVVRLEMEGFSPWTTTTRVAGGERSKVSGSLEQR